MKYNSLFIAVIFFFSSAVCVAQNNKRSPEKTSITLKFINKIGSENLQTDGTYFNSFGEQFSITNFKYYISNIILVDDSANETASFPAQYFLIDEIDSASKIITLLTTLRQVSAIHFLLGVDSVKNVSGIQTGSLDPANGMFWTWNTGYVMAKIEGVSIVANTPFHQFSWHVGGYKKGEAVARIIELQIPVESNQVLAISQQSSAKSIIIHADVLKWFGGEQHLKIAENPICHQPGVLAVSIADNYATMFTIAAENK